MNENNSQKIYDLGEIRFGDTVIPCDSFKVGMKIKNERRNVTNKRTGVGWKSSEEEYSFECSDVLPQYFEVLIKRWEEQVNDEHGLTISTYNFLENGEYKEQIVLYSCMLESVDMDQNNGSKVTVKGEALTKKKIKN